MVLDDSVRLCLLNDFYGSLLTTNQQKVLDLYLNFNTPLVEISQNLNISRQAVLDTIKKASKKLENFETKLGVLNKYLKQKEIVDNCSNENKSVLNKIMNVWK